MKILYHHRTVAKDGQDVHIEEMIAAMRRQGHEVRVVAPRMATQTTFGDDGGWLARIRSHIPRGLGEVLELLYSLYAYRHLRIAYAAFRPDVLYERYSLFLLAGQWLARQTGIPYLLEINSPLAEERASHGGLTFCRLARWSEGTVWRGADATFPVTAVLADSVCRAGVDRQRITVIPNGINPARFDGATDGQGIRQALGVSGRIVLGFVGFVRDWHGLPDVVAAMAAMENRDDLHFLIIGDGPGRAAVEAAAAHWGMTAQVRCLGVIERDRVAAHVAAFDIALQPKVVSYASPLKLFEYMGLGRAIVAPDQANIREVLVDEENALLFRDDEPGHFKAQIMRLCGDPGLRQRLGDGAARTIVKRGFTWDENVRRVLGSIALGEPQADAPSNKRR